VLYKVHFCSASSGSSRHVKIVKGGSAHSPSIPSYGANTILYDAIDVSSHDLSERRSIPSRA